jgi:membrane associated rhomboid family serine protease
MSSQPAMSFAFPKPGPALWGVLIVTTLFGIFTALFATWVPGGEQVFMALACERARAFTQPWRLLTSGLLTSPLHQSHLLFSLAGIYFLGAPLERRWGPWRFARFYGIAILFGNLSTLALAALAPDDAQLRFRPEMVFGPTAAITAIAVAWSREFRESTVSLFLVLPVRAKTLYWVTIALCVLNLIYPAGLPEGVIAPFGGIVAGLLWGGSPSLARRAWLNVRLAILRRRSGGMGAGDILSPKAKRRPGSGPPLRVVSGGVEETLKKRPPPKDKRYLN